MPEITFNRFRGGQIQNRLTGNREGYVRQGKVRTHIKRDGAFIFDLDWYVILSDGKITTPPIYAQRRENAGLRISISARLWAAEELHDGTVRLYSPSHSTNGEDYILLPADHPDCMDEAELSAYIKKNCMVQSSYESS